jgi:hypothetical protein
MVVVTLVVPVLIPLALTGFELLADCDPVAQLEVVAGTMNIGFLHGLLVPINAVCSCFDPSAGIYAGDHADPWYAANFVAGWFVLCCLAAKLRKRLVRKAIWAVTFGRVPGVRGNGVVARLGVSFRLALVALVVAGVSWAFQDDPGFFPVFEASVAPSEPLDVVVGLWHSVVCPFTLAGDFLGWEADVFSQDRQGPLYNLGWAFGGHAVLAAIQVWTLWVFGGPWLEEGTVKKIIELMQDDDEGSEEEDPVGEEG